MTKPVLNIELGQLDQADPYHGTWANCYSCGAPHVVEQVAIITEGKKQTNGALCAPCFADAAIGAQVARKYLQARYTKH